MKRFFTLASLLTPLTTAYLSGAARADELPLPQLKAQSTATTDLGAFELRAWSNRDAFPDLKEVAAVKAGDKGRYTTPGAAELTVKDGSLEMLSHGRAEFKPAFDWAPMLVFTPKTAGNYALGGTLKLGTNAQGTGDATATEWAVVRFREGDKRFVVVERGRTLGAATVDLTAKPKLSGFTLGEGERLAVTMWRPAWHWSGYGSLSGASVIRATPEAMRASLAALEAEKEAAQQAARAAIEAGRQSDSLSARALLASSVAQNKSGTFSLMGYTGRDAFPKLADGIEVRGGKSSDKSREWRTPGEAQFSVNEDGVTFRTNGRGAWDKKFDWLPVLQWTPRDPGTYRVSGILDLYTGQKSSDATKPDAVAWAVLKMSANGGAQIVAQGRYADKARVDLKEQAALQAVKLEAGESLALTVWRPTWHFNAGGTVKQLEINPAE